MDINLTNKDGVKLNTAGKYCAEDINVIPQLDTTTVTPAKGQQVIQPSNNKIGFSSVTVEAIPDDYVIPSGTQQITENGTYDVSGKANAVVNVESQAKEEQEKSITITENGSFTVTPDAGKTLSSVTGTVNVPTSGGGAELNIAYGDTAPSDTSKLWIKSTEPTNVTVSCNPEQQVEGLVDIDTTLPQAMSGATCSRVGDNIYIFGGVIGSSSTATTSIYKFNTSTKTISLLNVTLPNSISFAISATIGTKIYIFETTSHHYVFDTETETISTLSVTQPKSFQRTCCVSKESSIFIFGNSTDIYRYNAASNTFSIAGTLPTALYFTTVARVGAKIYIMGGSTTASTNYVDTIYEFDTDTLQISLLSTTLPTSTRWGAAESIGSNIFYFGGKEYTGSFSQKVYKFNTTTKEISTLSTMLPIGFYAATSEINGQEIFIFGGAGGSSETKLNTILDFVSSFVLTQNDILVSQDQTQNIFDLLSAPTRVQIGVKNVYKGNASNKAEFVDAYVHNGTDWINVNTGEAPSGSGYSVGITLSVYSGYEGSGTISVYDGTSTAGTLLISKNTTDSSFNETVTCTSGSLFIIETNATAYDGSIDSTSTTGGVTYVDSENITSGITLTVTGDGTFSARTFVCLTGDTLITLADGTEKRIDELSYEDKVLGYNPETKALVAQKVLYTDSKENKSYKEYDKWYLSDGSVIKTVHRHRFYNVERQAFVYMDEWNIGEHFKKLDGSTTSLVSHEKIVEKVKHYTLFTEYQNYFANGCLSGNRWSTYKE